MENLSLDSRERCETTRRLIQQQVAEIWAITVSKQEEEIEVHLISAIAGKF